MNIGPFWKTAIAVIFRGWCERPGAVSIGFGELYGPGAARCGCVKTAARKAFGSMPR